MILQNAAINSFGEIICSTHRHDFASFKSSDGFIDGGLDYIRRTVGDFKSLALYEASPLSERVAKAVWGTLGLDGKQPVEFKFMKDLDTDHLKNIRVLPISPWRKAVIDEIVRLRDVKAKEEVISKSVVRYVHQKEGIRFTAAYTIIGDSVFFNYVKVSPKEKHYVKEVGRVHALAALKKHQIQLDLEKFLDFSADCEFINEHLSFQAEAKFKEIMKDARSFRHSIICSAVAAAVAERIYDN